MALDATIAVENGIAKITLVGELDASVATAFREKIEEAAAQDAKSLVLMLQDLEYMSSAGLRVLVFAKQKMGASVNIYMVGAQPQILEPVRQSGFHHSVILMDEYDAAQIEG